jgi:glutamyl-tRNA reductase
VANRHRKLAIQEARRIVELVSVDFLDLLQDELSQDIDEALGCIRSNPALAIRHLQNARLRLETVLRSAQLIESRAEQIVQVLLSAPAEEKAEPGE